MKVTYHEYSNVWDVEGAHPIAHCIARDAKMGAGFAKQVTRKYPEVRKMVLETKPLLTDCVVTNVNGSSIFINMVTKMSSFGKPTQHAFENTVGNLSTTGFKEIHMPFIGTGLDGLSKRYVDEVLRNFAEKYGIEIHVHLERSKDF